MRRHFWCGLFIALVSASCGSSSNFSSVGESCAKRADCEQGAKCIDQVCVVDFESEEGRALDERIKKRNADEKTRREKQWLKACKHIAPMSVPWLKLQVSNSTWEHFLNSIGYSEEMETRFIEEECLGWMKNAKEPAKATSFADCLLELSICPLEYGARGGNIISHLSCSKERGTFRKMDDCGFAEVVMNPDDEIEKFK